MQRIAGFHPSSTSASVAEVTNHDSMKPSPHHAVRSSMLIPRIARLSAGLMLFTAACATTTPRPGAPSASPAADAPVQMVDSTDETARRIDGYLTALEGMGFSGAIIVEHRGRVVLRKGYGLASREARRAYTPATVQTMGSITKQITAAAILLLEERGALRIDDPIGKYLTDVSADKLPITLHHLLTHQSGLPDAIGWDAEPIDAAVYLVRAMRTPLEFEPGAGVGYSNVGYSLLGIIIERVTGRGYEEFVREELLLPAGLAATGYLLPAWPDSLLAAGYRHGELYGAPADRTWLPDGPGWNLRANGGLHTTPDDMRLWLRVVRGAGPLSAPLVAKWTDTHVVLNEELSLGYGWNIYRTPFGRLIAHTGGNPAFASAFNWIPDRDFFYYIHGNTSLWPAGGMEELLLRAAFDPEFESLPQVHPDPAARPALSAARTGTYAAHDGIVRLTADDTRLLAMFSGQSLVDAVLGHDRLERERFAAVNLHAARIIERLSAGREDALEGMVGAEEDFADRTRRILRLLERQGEMRSLSLVGSVSNVPGSRFADRGGFTSFVRADFENGSRIVSLLWREDGTYGGAAMGPLSDAPVFMLVPVRGGGFTGVERESPWRTRDFAFEGDCLIVADARACRE